MILVGIGANLPTLSGLAPLDSCRAALLALGQSGVTVGRRSRWYRSAPVPLGDQPWYVNGIAEVTTAHEPPALLAVLHGIERRFGRGRSAPNAARVLDLDLLLYDERVEGWPDHRGLVLPHPRLHQRAFVLRPLAELLPKNWRHPVLGKSLAQFIRAVPLEQRCEVLAV